MTFVVTVDVRAADGIPPTSERRERLVKLLKESESVTASDLLGVPSFTARRDLEKLVADGIAKVVEPGGSGRGRVRRYALAP